MKALVILLVFLCAQIKASDNFEVEGVIKSGRHKKIGKIVYSEKKEGIDYSIQFNSNYNVRIKSSESIERDGRIFHQTIYSAVDKTTGERSEIAIEAFNEGRRSVSLPLVSEEFPSGVGAIGQGQQVFISVKDVEGIKKVQEKLPKAFATLIIKDSASYKAALEAAANGAEYYLGQQKAYSEFQQRIMDKMGGSYAQRREDFENRLQQALRGMEAYDHDLEAVNQAVLDSLAGLGPAHEDRIDSEPRRLAEKTAINEEVGKFLRTLFASGSLKSFHSEHLDKEVEFDEEEPVQAERLDRYVEAYNQMNELERKDRRYFELKSAIALTELTQSNSQFSKSQASLEVDSVAESIVRNNPSAFVRAIELLGTVSSFQKGLAASILNNVNPVAVLFPVGAPCSDSYCQAGSYIGDAIGIALGGVEFLSGLALTVGSGGGAAVTSVATGGAGLVALPAGVAGAMAGVALAGHGAGVAINSLRSMYKKLNVDGPALARKLSEAINTFRKAGLQAREEIASAAKYFKLLAGNEAGAIGNIKGKLTRYGPINKGPLSDIPTGGGDTVADTFRSGSYFENSLTEPVKLYRVYDENTAQLSRYYSRIKPAGPGQATLDSALDPNWGNTAQKWVEITVPANQTIYEGVVSEVALKRGRRNVSAGKLLGGGSQVYLDKRKVPEEWISDWGDFQ